MTIGEYLEDLRTQYPAPHPAVQIAQAAAATVRLAYQDVVYALAELVDAAEAHYNVGEPGVDPDLPQMVRARAAIARAEGRGGQP